MDEMKFNAFILIEEIKINAFITHTTNILANHHFYLSHNHINYRVKARQESRFLANITSIYHTTII